MRSAAGASDLAHALRGWVSPEQAKELQSHVERGRLMLWLQPSRPEDFETVCAQMVQTSPHLVELPMRSSISRKRYRFAGPRYSPENGTLQILSFVFANVNFNVYLGETSKRRGPDHHAIEDMRFPKYCSFVRCYPPGSLCATGSRQSAAWS